MIEVFAQTLPFFVVIGLGFAAGRSGFFPPDANAYLTRFVFYFALSAMLFRFASNLSIGEVFSWPFVLAYLTASGVIYALATGAALWRKRGVREAAIEAQCAVVGNVGFLGIPMLAALIGPAAVGPVMLVLACDLIVFGSLVVLIMTASDKGRERQGIIRQLFLGLLRNPMIMSITLGLVWSSTGLAIPGPADASLELLAAAATPCALFAIGASLAGKSAERLAVAGWISFAKLILHPAAVIFAAFVVFDVDPFAASIMVACAAMPVAGNIYILAQHFGVAPQRVSSSILISTLFSIVTLTVAVAWAIA